MRGRTSVVADATVEARRFLARVKPRTLRTDAGRQVTTEDVAHSLVRRAGVPQAVIPRPKNKQPRVEERPFHNSRARAILCEIVDGGVLQQDIAARCGVKPPTVCRWIAGTRQPADARSFLALADMGIPLAAWCEPVDSEDDGPAGFLVGLGRGVS